MRGPKPALFEQWAFYPLCACPESFRHGFFRRNNGENVDLNRNFILDRSEVKNTNYRFFQRYLNPKTLWQYYAGLVEAWIHFKRLGLSESSQAIAAGQNEIPGLFFTGEKLQREIFLLLDYLKNNFKEVEFLFGLDMHTGLGDFGQESLFIDQPREPKGAEFFEPIFGRKIDFEDPSKGFYKNHGPLSDAIRHAFPRAQVHFVVQEFGTYPPIKTLGALRRQNLYWGSPKAESAADEMLEAFCPSSNEWRKKVLELGSLRFTQGLAALEQG